MNIHYSVHQLREECLLMEICYDLPVLEPLEFVSGECNSRFYVAVNSLGHIAARTWNRNEFLFPPRLVPSDIRFAEGLQTTLHNATHLFRDQPTPRGDPAETPTFELTLES